MVVAKAMPFGDMMRKIMEAKKSGAPFDCAKMMAQMMQMCGGSREKREEPKQNPVPNP